jgi:toxin ParE1/3/4
MTRKHTLKLQVRDVAMQAIASQALYYQEQAPDSGLGERWQNAVTNTILSLASMPERGARCEFPSAKLHDVRRVAVEGFPRHFVFYRYIAEELIVHVIDVVHGARDLESLL